VLESNIWDIGGNDDYRELQVEATNALHPLFQYALAEDEFYDISAAELYGMIWAWKPRTMLLATTNPIMVALLYEDELDPPDYYQIEWDEFELLKSFYVGSGIRPEPDDPINWSEEGF